MEQFCLLCYKCEVSVHMPVHKFTVHMLVDQEADAVACTRVKYNRQMLITSGLIL